MANYGMILGVAPTQVSTGSTITVDLIAAEAMGFQFNPPQIVRVLLHPDTPQLRQVIAGGGRSTGYLVVIVPSVNVISSTQLTFDLPPDAERIAQVSHNGRFLIEVQVGPHWAWTYEPIHVGVAAQPTAQLLFGNRGQVIDLSPGVAAVGQRVTARIDAAAGSRLAFSRSAEVRLFPDSPQLASLISGYGPVTGFLFVRAIQVFVLAPGELTFVIPREVTAIVRQTGLSQFMVQIDLGFAAAWSRGPITLGQAVSAAPGRAATTTPALHPGGSISPPSRSASPRPTSILGTPAPAAPAAAAPPPAPGTFVPPSPTVSVPVVTNILGTPVSIPGRGAGVGFAVSGTGTGSSSFPNPAQEPRQGSVRWVVEALTPIQDDRGAPQDRKLPDVVEAIVSAQLIENGEIRRPMADKLVRWKIFDPAVLPNDDSAILEVSADKDDLLDKFENRRSPSGETSAYSDQNGQTFCWIRLKLVDADTLIDAEQHLKGLRISIGEQTEVSAAIPPATGLVSGAVLATLASAMPVAAGMGAIMRGGVKNRDDSVLGLLPDILVNPLEEVIETAIDLRDGVMVARAALARSHQRVLGWWLKRTADGFILSYLDRVFPDQAAVSEQARATFIGLLLGMPRGLWVMGKDQINDIKTLISLVPLLIEFIQRHPGTTLTILANVNNLLTGPPGSTLQLTTKLAIRYREQIHDAINALPGAVGRFAPSLIMFWQSMAQMQINETLQTFGSQLFDEFYDGFRKFVGFIASDYLDYREDSLEYHHFVCGFIAGDFLGYIFGTIGLEVLLAYVTGGISTYVKSIGLLGKLARLGGPIAGTVKAFFKAYQAIKETLASAVGTVVDTLKHAIGRTLAGILHLFQVILERARSKTKQAMNLFVGLIKALAGATGETFSVKRAQRVWVMVFKLGDKKGPTRQLSAIARGIRGESAESAAATIDALAEIIEAGVKVAC